MATALYQSSQVTTADATPTVIASYPLPMDCAVMVLANVTARRTGGSAGTAGDSLGYSLNAVAKNVAGVSSIISHATIFSGEDQQGWTSSWGTSNGTLQLTVTGAANNTIKWLAFVNLYEVW